MDLSIFDPENTCIIDLESLCHSPKSPYFSFLSKNTTQTDLESELQYTQTPTSVFLYDSILEQIFSIGLPLSRNYEKTFINKSKKEKTVFVSSEENLFKIEFGKEMAIEEVFGQVSDFSEQIFHLHLSQNLNFFGRKVGQNILKFRKKIENYMANKNLINFEPSDFITFKDQIGRIKLIR